jgi:predicted nucleotidyltransferase/uncharacterized protein YlaN (UPF0358 family)
MTKEEIEKNLIFLFIRGSHAYGLNTETSDEDFGGVCLPTKNVIYGIEKFEQDDTDWFDEKGTKLDKVIYNLTKAVTLMTDCNPNMLDFLYAPERVIKFTTPQWQKFVDIKDEFLCIKVRWSFQGYALSQLRRLESHRGYLLNPPKKEPMRTDYGLSERSIFPETQCEVIARLSTDYVKEEERDNFYSEMTQMFDKEGALVFKKYIPKEFYMVAIDDFKKRQKEFLHMMSSISTRFLKDELIDVAQNELRYLSARYNWKRYKDWQKSRNIKRSEMEKKAGFDCKHAVHLYRLLKMCKEIMQGKSVLVDRTNIDKDYLMEIRNGNVPFEKVLSDAEQLNKEIDVLYKNCKLPESPNFEKINKIKVEILDEQMSKNIDFAKISNNYTNNY